MPGDWPALKRAANGNRIEFDDAVSDVLRTVCARVRGAVAAGPDKTLGAEGSVPPELEGASVVLCRLELISMIPGGVTLADEVRKELGKDARSQLELVAKGLLRVTPPDDAAAAAPDPGTGKSGGDEMLAWPDTTFSGDET